MDGLYLLGGQRFSLGRTWNNDQRAKNPVGIPGLPTAGPPMALTTVLLCAIKYRRVDTKNMLGIKVWAVSFEWKLITEQSSRLR
jgi:hypothetical protein